MIVGVVVPAVPAPRRLLSGKFDEKGGRTSLLENRGVPGRLGNGEVRREEIMASYRIVGSGLGSVLSTIPRVRRLRPFCRSCVSVAIKMSSVGRTLNTLG